MHTAPPKGLSQLWLGQNWIKKGESSWCSHKKKTSMSQSEILNFPVVLLKSVALGVSLIFGSCYMHKAASENTRAPPGFTHIEVG